MMTPETAVALRAACPKQKAAWSHREKPGLSRMPPLRDALDLACSAPALRELHQTRRKRATRRDGTSRRARAENVARSGLRRRKPRLPVRRACESQRSVQSLDSGDRASAD